MIYRQTILSKVRTMSKPHTCFPTETIVEGKAHVTVPIPEAFTVHLSDYAPSRFLPVKVSVAT